MKRKYEIRIINGDVYKVYDFDLAIYSGNVHNSMRAHLVDNVRIVLEDIEKYNLDFLPSDIPDATLCILQDGRQAICTFMPYKIPGGGKRVFRMFIDKTKHDWDWRDKSID